MAEYDAHEGEDREGTDEVFELQYDNVGDARSDGGDANNAVRDSNSIAEDPMVTREDELGRNRYNLRSNRERTYDNRFTHRMYNPASSKSYDDVQFLHQGASIMPLLMEAVDVMMLGSGSKTEVLSYVTGFIMT